MSAPSKYGEKLGPIQIGLRKELVFTRQQLGGQPRYVVHDPVTFQNHSFSVLEYRIMTAIIGERPLADCFDVLVADGVLTQARVDAFYEFVLALHGMKLLQLPICQPDTLFQRYVKKQRARRTGWWRAVSYVKIPIWNPDRFLDRMEKSVGWLFTRYGVALWAVLMCLVAWKCIGRFGEMFGESASLLALGNLPIMWVSLVVLKTIHEFGHAFACKRLGGEVPEMGLVFIIMTPCAYVDASASWKFSNRWHRIGVGLGGMYVESIVAGVFALIWAGTTPGFLHDVALNVVVLASVVTLLFNLNPLMRFDGYYVFSDLCGVVNLKQRGDSVLKSWAQRTFLGIRSTPRSYSRWERLVYGGYAPCSFVYRVLLAVGLTGAVMMQWPIAGTAIGLIFTWLMIVQPLLRAASYLLHAEETQHVRGRAIAVALGAIVVVPLTLAFLPVSSGIVCSAVLEPSDAMSIRAPTDGFVESIRAKPGLEVAAGETLCVLRNPAVALERIVFAGECAAERERFETTELVDPVAAQRHRARLTFLQRSLDEVEQRLRAMRVVSQRRCVVIAAETEHRAGRYVRRGEELLRVRHGGHRLRLVLRDEDIARADLEVGVRATLRWTSDPSRTVQAVVREIRRSASRDNVPLSLTMLGGGDVYALRDPEGSARADMPYLHVFLECTDVPVEDVTGLTAQLRIPAKVETLGGWIRRRLVGFYNAWRMS